MKHLVFFASGSGTNFQSVTDAIESGAIEAKISGLITNKKGIGALERARDHGIPSKILQPSSFSAQQEYENALIATLAQWKPNLIVLAGYLLKIPKAVIQAYPGQIINIHPSLLPKYGGQGFYGDKVHKAVIDNGESESGCSVHIVDEEYDQGPVLAQRAIPVHPSDTAHTLAERVLEQEHTLLPEVIKNYI